MLIAEFERFQDSYVLDGSWVAIGAGLIAPIYTADGARAIIRLSNGDKL